MSDPINVLKVYPTDLEHRTALIERAKRWARAVGVSEHRCVSKYLLSAEEHAQGMIVKLERERGVKR